MSYFLASFQSNQFGKTKKSKLLHVTVKLSISYVSESFWMSLWSNPTLDVSGQNSLILQHQLWGYKSLELTTKHHKTIPVNLVLHIYRKLKSYLRTSIGKIIAGAFLFSMRSFNYCTNPKGDNKQTRILWKGGIKFYSKQRKLRHIRGHIHLVDKVSPTLNTHKNGVKNLPVTQCVGSLLNGYIRSTPLP